MGCSFSGLNALYDVVNGGGDVWINENRFRIVRQLGEGGFAYVYLVKEVITDAAAASAGLAKKVKDPSHLSGSLFYSSSFNSIMRLFKSCFPEIFNCYNLISDLKLYVFS